VILHVA